MKKTLIALAITSLPAAAMADVTLYGTITGGVESNKTYNDGVATSTASNGKITTTRSWQINDWTTVLGFKGNEDLGNGLKAIWQVESRLHIDGTSGSGNTSSSDGFATRDSFVGLSGNFGTVKLGRNSNYGNSDMETFDVGSYSGVSVAGTNDIERFDGRWNNSIRYDSPEFAGFSGTVVYASDEARTSGTNAQKWNLGLGYNNGPFSVKYTYNHVGDAQKNATLASYQRIEAGYSANNLNLVLGYQYAQGYVSASGTDAGVVFAGSNQNSSLLSSLLTAKGQTLTGTSSITSREFVETISYNMGKFTPSFTVVSGSHVRVAGEGLQGSGYSQYIMGLRYDVSKRTSFYGSVGREKFATDLVDAETSLGLGIVHRF